MHIYTVWDHESTQAMQFAETSCFNCNNWSVEYAWILNNKNKRTKMLNKINSRL